MERRSYPLWSKAEAGVEAAVLVPVEEWRRLQKAARPTLKELLLAESPRADIPVPARRGRRRRAPAAMA